MSWKNNTAPATAGAHLLVEWRYEGGRPHKHSTAMSNRGVGLRRRLAFVLLCSSAFVCSADDSTAAASNEWPCTLRVGEAAFDPFVEASYFEKANSHEKVFLLADSKNFTLDCSKFTLFFLTRKFNLP